MALVSLDCPNCGAKLPPREDSGRTRCEYCGATFEAARAVHHPSPPQLDPRVVAQQKAVFRRAVVLSLVMGGLGVGFSLLTMRGSGPVHRVGLGAAAPRTVAGSGVVGPSENRSDFMWDDSGGRPVVVTLDGKEHVLGRIRDRAGEHEDKLFVAAFDAETGAARYRVGPLGSHSDALRHAYFAVADGRLVVSEFPAKLRFCDLATGATQKEIALTDRPEMFCLVEETGKEPRLYFSQVDERAFLVDPVAGALKPDKLPKSCDRMAFLRTREGDPASRRPDRLRLAPKVDGFEAGGVQLDGDLAVARGVKSPGTEYPIAVGFDPKTRAVRWKEHVASIDLASVRERDNTQDALAGGRYFATYGEGSEFWHLTAFDAETGVRLWDNRLRSVFAVDWLHDLVATDRTVYLVRMSSLEIYDAATGALKVTLGAETYDR